jgi:hypothetical protein
VVVVGRDGGMGRRGSDDAAVDAMGWLAAPWRRRRETSRLRSIARNINVRLCSQSGMEHTSVMLRSGEKKTGGERRATGKKEKVWVCARGRECPGQACDA